MKCDVCLTKIPLGQNRCPNCGFAIKPEIGSSYNEVSSTHEHITVGKKKNDDTSLSDVQETITGFFSEIKDSFEDLTKEEDKVKKETTRDWYDTKPRKKKNDINANKVAKIITSCSIIFICIVFITLVLSIFASDSGDSGASSMMDDACNYISDNTSYGFYAYSGNTEESASGFGSSDYADYELQISQMYIDSDTDKEYYSISYEIDPYDDNLNTAMKNIVKDDNALAYLDLYFLTDSRGAISYALKSSKKDTISYDDINVTINDDEVYVQFVVSNEDVITFTND